MPFFSNWRTAGNHGPAEIVALRLVALVSLQKCQFFQSFHSLAAILAPCRQFNARADLLRQRFRRAARAVCDQAFSETLGNDICHLLSNQFLALVSESFLGL